MGKYAEHIKLTPVSQSVNACQTWSNGQAFRHGFSDAKTACCEIAAEADARIEKLEAALQMMLDDAAHLAGFSERTEKAAREALDNG